MVRHWRGSAKNVSNAERRAAEEYWKVKGKFSPGTEFKQLIRSKVIQRDGQDCFFWQIYQDPKCQRRAMELHHVIPRSRPFDLLWDICNLVMGCTYCHHKYGQWRKSRVAILDKLQARFGYDYTASPFNEYVG